MYVIALKRGQSIKIGDNIVISVDAIRPNRARVGIDAPRSVPVHCAEVYEAIQAKNANNQPDDGRAA